MFFLTNTILKFAWKDSKINHFYRFDSAHIIFVAIKFQFFVSESSTQTFNAVLLFNLFPGVLFYDFSFPLNVLQLSVALFTVNTKP